MYVMMPHVYGCSSMCKSRHMVWYPSCRMVSKISQIHEDIKSIMSWFQMIICRSLDISLPKSFFWNLLNSAHVKLLQIFVLTLFKFYFHYIILSFFLAFSFISKSIFKSKSRNYFSITFISRHTPEIHINYGICL